MFNVNLLGERIREVRGKKSQDVFATELGISRGALSFYENGERKPDAEIIYKICEFCNVSSDYLLGFTDNPTTDPDLGKFLKYTGLNEKAYDTLCVNYKLKEDFKQLLVDEDYNGIQNWIISNYYLHRIISVLGSIKKMSKDIAKEMPKENPLPPNAFYDLCELVEYSAVENNKDYVGIEEFAIGREENRDIFDDLIRTNTLCDTKRYNLIKIVEEMANNFDQREQVRNSVKHNPPKE